MGQGGWREKGLSGEQTSGTEKCRFLLPALWVCAGGGQLFSAGRCAFNLEVHISTCNNLLSKICVNDFMTHLQAGSSLWSPGQLPSSYLFHCSLWHFTCLNASSLVGRSAYAMSKDGHAGFGRPGVSSRRATLPWVHSICSESGRVWWWEVGLRHPSGAS